MTFSDFQRSAVSFLVITAACVTYTPTACGEEATATTLAGGMRLQFLWQSTDDGDGVETRDQARIDKVWFDATTKWAGHWHTQLTLEAKNVGASSRTGPELRELTVQYSREWGRLFAGQFVLPFGRFASSQISDPQTKELGEWFTNAGIGAVLPVSNEGRMEFSGFTNNDQTADSDQDGVTLATQWSVPGHWRLGAALLATTRSEGRDIRSAWTATGEVELGAWKMRAEFLARHYVQVDRQSAWFADVAYHRGNGWEFGIRRQGAEGYAVIEDAEKRYRDWGMTLRYRFTQNLSLGIELLRGEQLTTDGETVSRDELRSRLEIRV